MLYQTHFYHAQTRKLIVAFGNLFRTISVTRKDSNGNELHRERVPITYSAKEKFIQRLISDLNTAKEISVKLPRLAFQMTGIAYNPERKLSSKNKIRFQDGTDKRSWTYGPVPYDVDFELSIFTKSQDEGLQIIEQILPFFTPDYNVSIKMLDNQTDTIDVPFNLVGVAPEDQFEGPFEDNRVITWTLNFVAKAMYFGPLRTTDKIRAVQTNYYDLETQSLIGTDLVYHDGTEVLSITDYDGQPIPGLETPQVPVQSDPGVLAITQAQAFSDSLNLINEANTPLDLTGATVRVWLRRNLSASDFRDFTVSITGDPTNGQIAISLTSAKTKKLDVGSWIYEMEIDFPNGSTDRGVSGTAIISAPSIG